MWDLSGNASGGFVFDEGAFAARPRPLPVGSATVPIAAPVAPLAAGPTSPTLQQEVAFISGVNADGSIAGTSYWSSYEHITAYKFGTSTAGTGATISYAFDPTSAFTATEQATFREALATLAIGRRRAFRHRDVGGAGRHPARTRHTTEAPIPARTCTPDRANARPLHRPGGDQHRYRRRRVRPVGIVRRRSADTASRP